ncbi:unnamed protein product, partial [Vitis vinifera]|uniref:Uncharacterized protein n=1 Tax=Vitis vinifera TaxID=29760 RepID=D7SRS1_VITVI
MPVECSFSGSHSNLWVLSFQHKTRPHGRNRFPLMIWDGAFSIGLPLPGQPQIPGVTPQIRQNMTSTHPLASNGVGQQITTST